MPIGLIYRDGYRGTPPTRLRSIIQSGQGETRSIRYHRGIPSVCDYTTFFKKMYFGSSFMRPPVFELSFCVPFLSAAPNGRFAVVNFVRSSLYARVRGSALRFGHTYLKQTNSRVKIIFPRQLISTYSPGRGATPRKHDNGYCRVVFKWTWNGGWRTIW